MKKRKNKSLIKKNFLIEDEAIELQKSRGNGILRRQIWINEVGEVTRYSLVYINYNIYAGDNGRVLCYDNAHGYHHRHYLGKIDPIDFKSFQEIEERFQQEFEVIHEKIKKK